MAQQTKPNLIKSNHIYICNSCLHI